MVARTLSWPGQRGGDVVSSVAWGRGRLPEVKARRWFRATFPPLQPRQAAACTT